MTDDPFDALGLEPRFDLDEPELLRAWRRRSVDAHPDRAGGEDEARRRAAALNDARRRLEDPESRADALVLRLGGPSREEENGLPAGFLMEIMELRESLEAAQSGGDDLDPHRRRAETERAARMVRVREGFAEPEPDLRAIRVELNAWRYLERMLEQIEAPVRPGGAR